MLALMTGDAWASVSIDVDNGGGAQTYTPQAPYFDAYSGAVDLLSWLEATFPGLWSWTWARDATTAGATITFSASSGTYTVTANAAAQTVMGLAAAASGVTSFAGVWAGTQVPAPGYWSVMGWYADHSGGGISSGVGALRSRFPGDGRTSPSVRASCKALGAARLTSILASAINPRQGYVYALGSDVWRLISVGDVSTQRGKMIFSVTVAAHG